MILHGADDLPAAVALGFPVFVKGLVKSAKEHGLDACLTENPEALRSRASAAWERGQTLVAREYLPLRLTGVTVTSFPHAREYRFILLDKDVLARAFYWPSTDPFPSPTGEAEALGELIIRAAERLDARLLAIDVGQLQDGSWRVIEVGDAQHTALAHIPPHLYWTTLQDRLR